MVVNVDERSSHESQKNEEHRMNAHAETTDQLQLVTRVQHFFDEPRNYLERRRYEIRVRAETIESLLTGRKISSILDIGCGDGSISLPLLSSERHLTLLDVSPNMLSLAQARVPESLIANVNLMDEDFLTAPLAVGTYDVVLCIGVLAHVSSPSDVIGKIATLLKPGGLLILQCTDFSHFVRRRLASYSRVWGFLRPPLYSVANRLTGNDVLEMTARCGFRPTARFGYSCALPGFHRIFPQAILYRTVRAIFGDVAHNRNLWLASEHIYSLVRY
jgi:2-polyprenyl-3-methyl-5-hydroxy-6-metoxy-1,4-benzoquinol methylase